jgi:regulation of enolase protein 1 (concanavalin A-like superfamily)
MQWMNEPLIYRHQAGELSLRAAAQTDFWRKTHDGDIRHNGHFWFQPVSGNFTASVKITGKYRDQYDQAGLMVRIDESTWLKCGIEYKDGAQCASTVVTRDWSDWSIVELNNPESTWIRLERLACTFETAFSLDGRAYRLMRQAYLSGESQLDVGLMIAAPTGPGFDVTFSNFTLTSRAEV